MELLNIIGLQIDNIRTNYIVVYEILGLISAVLALNTYNPIVCLAFFISLICNSAFYLVSHGIHFIGFTYILIYVGAIAILFLFIIMLLNMKSPDLNIYPYSDLSDFNYTSLTKTRSYILILAIFISIFYLFVFNIVDYNHDQEGVTNSLFYIYDLYYLSIVNNINMYEYTDLSLIGNLFYSNYFMLFIFIGYILILSIIASIYLVSLN